MNLRTKLGIAFICMALIPLIVLGTWRIVKERSLAESRIYETLEMKATTAARQLESYVENSKHKVNLMASDEELIALLESPSSGANHPVMEHLQYWTQSTDFTAIEVLDTKGVTVLQAGVQKIAPEVIGEPRDFPHSTVSVEIDSLNDHPFLVYRTKLRSKEHNEVIGLLVATSDLKEKAALMGLFNVITHSGNIILTSSTSLSNGDRITILSFRKQPSNSSNSVVQMDAIFKKGQNPSLSVGYLEHEDGERELVAYRDIDGLEATLIVGMSLEEFAAWTSFIGPELLITVFLIILIAAVASYLIANNISRPIIRVTEAFAKMKQGRKVEPFTAIRSDEAGKLMQAFSELIAIRNMIDEMAKRISEGEDGIRLAPRSDEDLLVQSLNRMAESLEHQRKEIMERNYNLEAQVAERTYELKRTVELLQNSNKELEAFSYSISHDLRAPLRALFAFSNRLKSKYSGKLDDDATRWLDFIQTNAERMDQLILDVLQLSRLNREELNMESIDPHDVIQPILIVLESNTSKEIEVNFVRELPKACADRGSFSLVWQNLLDNAVKYSSANEKVVIDIDGWVEGGFTYFSVRDHGVGFDMKFRDKIFNVFGRAHNPEEYEGTGIGLAIVKRILHKHQGIIEVDSRPGIGTSFTFCFPRGKHLLASKDIVTKVYQHEKAG